MMHDPYGKCTKIGLFSAPVLFSDCSLLSLGKIFEKGIKYTVESVRY